MLGIEFANAPYAAEIALADNKYVHPVSIHRKCRNKPFANTVDILRNIKIPGRSFNVKAVLFGLNAMFAENANRIRDIFRKHRQEHGSPDLLAGFRKMM